MQPMILCAALALAACAAPPLTPAEVARVRSDDVARLCQAARAADAATCKAQGEREHSMSFSYQPPSRDLFNRMDSALRKCSASGWGY